MGRITVFTESLCSESDNVKYLLDCYELPFVEINLSTHTGKFWSPSSELIQKGSI